jgi:hypothetical protein
MNNPKNYINHSGKAPGADTAWDNIGRWFGVTNHKHWTPEDLELAHGLMNREVIIHAVDKAAAALGRPAHFPGRQYVERNWFQAHHAQGIYAIGQMVEPGEPDFKGFVNKTNKAIVAGGTGWTVEMGIQMGKEIYLFDQDSSDWWWWDYIQGEFQPNFGKIPELAFRFAGIGTRTIQGNGIKAIFDVYQKAFGYNLKATIQ